MNNLPTLTRINLLTTLSGAPAALAQMLRGYEDGDPVWNARPNADRFTLHEMLEHLAVVEPRWMQRTLRMRDEETPHIGRQGLPDPEGAKPPSELLALWRERRAEYVDFLRNLMDDDWKKQATTEFLGTITIEDQMVYVVSHDGYHLEQATDILARV